MKVVRINWVDSCYHGSGRWIHAEDLRTGKKFLEYESVGFLLEETDVSYVLAGSAAVDRKSQDCVGSVLEIPKCAVSRMQVLDDT